MSIYKDWLDFNQAYVQLEQIKILINKLPNDLEGKVSDEEDMDLFTLTTIVNRLAAVFHDRAIEATNAIAKEDYEYHK